MKATLRTFAAAALGLFAATAVAETYTLNGDEDWSNRVDPFPAEVDLNGHNLTVTRLEACTITDSSDTGLGGELHVNVANNVDNTSVRLTGSLKLVKGGAGTFTATKTGQAYSGGTEIAGGMLTLPSYSEESKVARLGVGGSAITVDAGATLELNASKIQNHPLVLAGGTVQTATESGTAAIGAVTLTANSKLCIMGKKGILNMYGDVDLGGFELTEEQKKSGSHFGLVDNAVFKNGAVIATGSGFYDTVRSTTSELPDVHMETVDFTLNCALALNSSMWVRDLTVTYKDIWYGRTENKTVHICGTYTPTGTFILDFMMENGSTLNLRDKTDVWTAESQLDKQLFQALKFADNATIKVIPPKAYPFNQGRKIVSWSDAGKPANLDTLTFTVAPGYDGYIVKKDNGLYYHRGATLIFR